MHPSRVPSLDGAALSVHIARLVAVVLVRAEPALCRESSKCVECGEPPSEHVSFDVKERRARQIAQHRTSVNRAGSGRAVCCSVLCQRRGKDVLNGDTAFPCAGIVEPAHLSSATLERRDYGNRSRSLNKPCC
jgi:hypothetical protein